MNEIIYVIREQNLSEVAYHERVLADSSQGWGTANIFCMLMSSL